jgi:tetratricopeptide (TPR) repeat protein
MTRGLRLIACATVVLATAPFRVSTRQQDASATADRLQRYTPGVSVVEPLARDALWTGAGDFRRDALAWVTAGGAADAARRRLAAATYVLDLLKDVEEPGLWEDSQAAVTLLEWACARLREAPPLPTERAWHVAAMALVERSSTFTVLQRHLEHAESRVPNDDKWLLARALGAEWQSRATPRDDGTLVVPGGLAARAVQHFQQAAEKPSVRQEALLRWGAYESDLGRHDAALEHLKQVGDAGDPFVRYWLGLIRGRVLARANRTEEAIEAYRTAMAEVPLAQSARLGLAAALVSARRMAEAAALVNSMVAADNAAAVSDPWRIYRSPDVRFWPRALDELRQAVAR